MSRVQHVRRLLSTAARSLPQQLGDRAASLQQQLTIQRLQQQAHPTKTGSSAGDKFADDSSTIADALAEVMMKIEPRNRGERALDAHDCTAALELSVRRRGGAVREAKTVDAKLANVRNLWASFPCAVGELL